MRKIVWNVTADHNCVCHSEHELNASSVDCFDRLGLPDIDGLIFFYRKLDESILVWVKYLNDIGLMVIDKRRIESGFQIKLACGVFLSFYTTGTVMVQGRVKSELTPVVNRLRTTLDSLMSLVNSRLSAMAGDEF